jgi:hypothetical protein
LDSNYATAITIGNTAVQLGNTVTTLNNMTLANVTISSGTITITNVAVTTANVSGTANISTLVVVGNATVGGTLSTTGDATVGSAGGTRTLTIGNTSSTGAGFINLVTSSSFKNWQIASNQYVASALSFTPSTATGGTTFTTPNLNILDNSIAVTGSISSTGGFTSNTTITAQLDGSDSAGAGPGFNLFNTAFSRGWRTQLSASNNKVDYYFNGSAYVAATAITTSGVLSTYGGATVRTVQSVTAAFGSAAQTNAISINSFDDSGKQFVMSNNNGNTSVFSGDGSAGVVLSTNATSWSTFSDERIKDIIEPITDAANKVATLRTVIGKYKTDEEGVRRIFLIAQDVQAVLPEAVKVSEDEIGTLNLSYTEVIPLLVAAIKEQSALITQLQADVAALKGATP